MACELVFASDRECVVAVGPECMDQVSSSSEPAKIASMMGSKEFNARVLPFTMDRQSKRVSAQIAMSYARQNISVAYVPNSFSNTFGQTIDPWDLVGSTGIRYPGE